MQNNNGVKQRFLDCFLKILDKKRNKWRELLPDQWIYCSIKAVFNQYLKTPNDFYLPSSTYLYYVRETRRVNQNEQSKDIGNIGHKLQPVQVLEMGEHLLFLVRLPPIYPYNQVR